MKPPRIVPVAAGRGGAILIALLSLSCFEPPITETLEIRFLPGNAALVAVRVKLASPGSFKQSPPARDRIEAVRRDLAADEDEWSRRIRQLEPERERIVWDRGSEGLEQVSRRAILGRGEAIPRFFSDTLVPARFTAGEEESEFTLTPEPGGRASRAQREAYGRLFDQWIGAMDDYLEAGTVLYRYVERNPERARACLGTVFEALLPAEQRVGSRELDPSDRAVVEPFRKAMDAALTLFEVPEDSAYSLDELSRLVHDPFPAPLTVRVPGPILEKEGFEEAGPGVLRVPGLSLGAALLAEEERWIRPNPMVILYRRLGHREGDFSLEDLLRRPRAASAPGRREIADGLAAHLSRAPVYRVRWSTRGIGDLEDLPDAGSLWSHPALAEDP